MEFKKLFAIDQRGIEKPLAILQSAIEFAATAAKDSDEGNMFGYERPGRADIMHKYDEEMEATYGEKYTGFTKTHEDSKRPVGTQENAPGRDAGRDQSQNDTRRSSDDQGNGQPQEAEVKIPASEKKSPWNNPSKAPNLDEEDALDILLDEWGLDEDNVVHASEVAGVYVDDDGVLSTHFWAFPSEEVRNAFKQAGWKWSRNHKEWRHSDNKKARQWVSDYLSQFTEDEGQEGLKFSKGANGIAGADASTNRIDGKEKETVQTARTEISSTVGENTVKALEESGRVEVVGSLEDLPTEISEQMNFSRASNVDHEQRYENAIKKLQEALKNRTSAHRVAFNDSLHGWIDIDWGRLGEILDEIQFKTKGAMGLSHIIDKRSINDQLSPEEVAAVLRMMIRTMVEGQLVRRGGTTSITFNGFRIALGRSKGSNDYVITAFGSTKSESRKTASDKAEAGSSVRLDPATQLPATLHARRTLSSGDRNRNLSAIADIIVRENLLIKYSKDGTVQGIYDPATGKSYIIAGNIKKGEARGVFMHEIGIHMAADKEFRQTMQPIIKRAQQIVNVGFRNGDPTAIEAHRRLIEAGEKESNAEEACAYLTEVAANSKKLSGPIRQWFRRLKAAINAWLIRHNFRNVNKLSTQDIVDIALSNIRAMAKESVKTSHPQYQQPSLAVKFSVNKEAGPGGSHSRNTSWGLGPIWTKDEFGDYKFNWGEKLYAHRQRNCLQQFS